MTTRKWEYKTAGIYRHGWSWEGDPERLPEPETLERLLRKAGQDGWELVSTLPDDTNSFAVLLFKRPVAEDED